MGLIRRGIKDIWWQSFMVKNAKFEKYDIPFCPTVLSKIPTKIITYKQARELVKKNRSNPDFKSPAFVCFYQDDDKFDSSYGIWFRPKQAYKYLKHFKGIITPDFSTYMDFPYPLKLWNTYRMRAFGYWMETCGLEVINNVRGDVATFDFCTVGIPKDSVIAIGVVGSGLQYLKNRPQFEQWLDYVINEIHPIP